MIRRLVILVLSVQVLTLGLVLTPSPASAQISRANYCRRHIAGFFGFPTWYKYLDVDFGTPECEIDFDVRTPSNYVAVGLAVFEIVMRVAGMAALAFVMYGAFQFLTSGGEPDKYAAARTTISNALIGLVIALSAVVVVNLIGNTI